MISMIGEQLRQQWDNRLVFGATDLLERYSAGQLYVYVRVDLHKGDEWAAIFKNSRAAAHGEQGRVGEVVGAVSGVQQIEADDRERNQSMLVGVIEVLQEPQRVRVRGCASMVGLKRGNQISGGSGDALYLLSGPAAFVTLPCIEDWELVRSALVESVPLAVSDHELMDQVIEGRTELVDRLTGKQDDPWRWRPDLVVDSDEADLPRGEIAAALFIDPNGVRFQARKVGNITPKLLEMGFGPF